MSIRDEAIAVIVPVFNEEENVRPLAEEFLPLQGSLPKLTVIFADDGSSDQTGAQLDALVREYPSLVSFVRHEKCQGQSAALHSGMRYARAEGAQILVLMDGDRQNNPSDIPQLIDGLDQADVVCGYRAERKDTASRRFASKIGNGVRNAITRDGLRDTGCSLKAFRAACADDLPLLDGMHRFMGAYFKLNDRRMSEIPVDHRPRVAGTSKYTNLSRLPRTVYDLFGFCWYRRRYLAPSQDTTSK